MNPLIHTIGLPESHSPKPRLLGLRLEYALDPLIRVADNSHAIAREE